MGNNYELLIHKLNAFIKEYYKNLILRGFIYSLMGMLLMLIGFAIIEHFGFLSTAIRSVFFWTYCTIALLIIIRLIILPSVQMFQLAISLSHEDAAKIIGAHFSEVSDKLLNILELKDLSHENEALIHASINQKIKSIEFAPFNNAIDWKRTMRQSKYLAIPVFIILLFFLSGNKQVISESTFRIINYNTPFVKPAPFYFELINDSLVGIENQEFTIYMSISGEELPQEAHINYGGVPREMTKLSKTRYSHRMSNTTENIDFYFSANNEFSQIYNLHILDRPAIESIDIKIAPPKHTGIKQEIRKNPGSISVPEGAKLSWTFYTKNANKLNFSFNASNEILAPQKQNIFKINKTIKQNSKYEVSLRNDDVVFMDTLFYDIQVINDGHPSISIKNEFDSTTNISLITGLINDDYGFFDLNSFKRIYGLSRDTLITSNIDIDKGLRSQSFIQPISSSQIIVYPGESVEYYFIVRDNDATNGYKASTSTVITINLPSEEEIQDNYEEENEQIKNDLIAEISMLKDIEKELVEFEKELIQKDSLTWRDKKKLEDIMAQQAKLENKIADLKNAAKSNFDKLNSIAPPTEEIIKKQQELDKLFDEIMPEEMKDLYKELRELKDKLDKNQLQQKIQELKLSNEDIEKELDRNLEILKQLEFDQKIDHIINQINKLKADQLSLSSSPEKTSSDKIKDQEENQLEFEKIQKNIKEIKELNNSLENKQKMPPTTEIESDVKRALKEGLKNLQENKKKRAQKSQKKTGEKLEELANLLQKMQQKNKEEQQYENMDVLRQILENLVYFSIKEEDIFLTFQGLDKNDPIYISLMHQQQNLRAAARVIEDSLFALSKRVPQISSKINREINAIDQKSSDAIDYLRERLTQKAVQSQQFVMTSANNLAVLLSQVLEKMQEDMANDMPSDQQCEKPGKGSPKPGDLKKMQQELSEHLKKMQEQIENGEKNSMNEGGISKGLVEMLAKQEMIRQSLQELKKEMESSDGLNSLQKAIEEMKKTELDIANKKITQKSLERQKNILTRLLEVENAMRQQGEDDEREGSVPQNEFEKLIQDAYEQYELEKLKQTELLKTTPAELTKYYKEQVDRYFNLILK